MWDNAIHLYAIAGNKAGSVEPVDAVKALESGISFDAPEGRITLDGMTHHVTHAVHLGRVSKEHTLEIIKSWDNIEPFWLREIGVDLTKQTQSRQYSPLDQK